MNNNIFQINKQNAFINFFSILFWYDHNLRLYFVNNAYDCEFLLKNILYLEDFVIY